MTVQVQSATFGKSKKVLQQALTESPQSVRFHDPSFFNPRSFTGADIKPGEKFPVVMDPATRQRFSTVERKSDGSFRVS